MATVHFSTGGHQWVERTITLRDSTYLHRRCVKCNRDLVKTDTTDWRAVHLGGMQYDFLDAATTTRWLSEECPGEQLAEEANVHRKAN